jgi:formylglycine-generating enzyme required for sulfatase activity
MDETEITNSEYREFVEWVKDSTMNYVGNISWWSGQTATIRKQKVKMLGIADFAFNDSDPEKWQRMTNTCMTIIIV